MKLSTLIQGYPCKILSSREDPEIEALVCHTEKIRPRSLWFCIPGERVDPTTLIPLAIRRGAAAIVLPSPASLREYAVPLVGVEDVRNAASHMLYRFYGLENAPLRYHAITGTNGKTSTAHLLEHILRSAGNKTFLAGTLGMLLNGAPYKSANGATTPPPEVLFPEIKSALSQGVTDVILEVSSHGIAQKRVAPIHFKTAIFTNLSPEHLDYHQSMENYAKTKARLFSNAEMAVYCSDVPYASEICETAVTKLCHGKDRAIQLSRIKSHAHTTEFFLTTPHEAETISLPVTGSFQAQNAALALLAAESLGIPLSVGRDALRQFPGIPGRMECITDRSQDISVYLDYAHTEEALRAALSAARALTDGRVTAVFGCGGNRDTAKRAPMGKAAEEMADFVILTSDNSRGERPVAILKDILKGMKKENHRVIPKRERAIRLAILSARPGDLILLAGKGHELYEDGPYGKRPFSEREIAKKALEERKRGILTKEDV